jgi:transcription-repair coupling factor (superfamily II helicase)
VIQKEKFKKLKPGIDILYLSATPIPRTLYMALTGIKDISNVHTPPPGRKDIETRIMFWDDDEIKRIVEAELNRGGQVFFIHNRIQSIEIIRSRLQNLLPEVRIGLIHGQMRTDISECRMIDFLSGKYNLLLSTAIVESGLDMPRVNTIVVNEAHKFGLADLHQLRGRVGRSDLQAHAYFLIPEVRVLTEEANKRLNALNSYASLGSGFRLALRDMEIRGIGDLLGKEQSGVMDAVGYHHYVKILTASVNEMRGTKVFTEPVLSLKIDAYFPSPYIESAYERTALYKRLLDVESKFELESIRSEILDRFGRYPREVENMFYVSELRLRAIELGATEVIQRGDKIVFFRKQSVIDQIAYEDND